MGRTQKYNTTDRLQSMGSYFARTGALHPSCCPWNIIPATDLCDQQSSNLGFFWPILRSSGTNEWFRLQQCREHMSERMLAQSRPPAVSAKLYSSGAGINTILVLVPAFGHC